MKFSENNLRLEILKLRQAIREHRDQKGDDRCWLDDYSVWKLLWDSQPEFKQLPSFEEGMKKCHAFYSHRRSDSLDKTPVDVIKNKELRDKDLEVMDELQLLSEWRKIQLSIRQHRDINNRERTIEDDKKLYKILPEKIPADFRLPDKETFLDVGNKKAGCPQFWKSHASCQTKEHDLHQWGPC